MTNPQLFHPRLAQPIWAEHLELARRAPGVHLTRNMMLLLLLKVLLLVLVLLPAEPPLVAPHAVRLDSAKILASLHCC